MFSVHCEKCGSTSIALIGAIAEWDMKAQGWRIEDMYDPTFVCGECGCESNECEERKVTDETEI